MLRLLREGADVGTALHAAARAGHINIVQALLHASADIHAVDRWGDNPLAATLRRAAERVYSHSRADACFISVAEMLLQAGAAVTATALAAAVTWLAQQRQQQPQPAGLEGTPVSALWRSLLAAVDVTDSAGRTALYIAAERMPAAVEVLLSAGASTSSTCGSFGDTVLHAAAIRSCWVLQEECELVRSALQRLAAAAAAAAGCLNAFNAHGETPLALLICDDTRANRGLSCLERVRVLLAAGADPNAAGPDTDTPLVRAVRECDGNPCGIEVVSALLSAGADPYLAPEHGLPSTAVGIAVRKGKVDIVRLLLQPVPAPAQSRLPMCWRKFVTCRQTGWSQVHHRLAASRCCSCCLQPPPPPTIPSQHRRR